MMDIFGELSGRNSKDQLRTSLHEKYALRWTHIEVLRPLFHAAAKRLQIAETAAQADNTYLAHMQLKQSTILFEQLQSYLGTIDMNLTHRFAIVISHLECCLRDINSERIGQTRELLLQRRDAITEIFETAMPDRE